MIEGKDTGSCGNSLRFAMVGGGPGAFIGYVHRTAATLDGKAELVAGVFSRDRAKSVATAERLGLDPQRVYGDFEEMAAREGAREDRIDFVSVVTPNHMHYSVARAFLRQGISVACDKPFTLVLAEAEELARIAEATSGTSERSRRTTSRVGSPRPSSEPGTSRPSGGWTPVSPASRIA